MNLSHYELLDPHMHHGHGKKGVEAGGETFPAHNPAPVLALKPGTRPLDLIARHVLVEWPPPRFAALPHPCGNLGPDTAAAAATAEVCGVIPLIHRQHLEALTWPALCAGAEVQGIQPRHDLSPLVPIGRRRARGQGHACTIREAMDEETFTVAAIGDPLTAALARGQRSHPPRRRATESARVPRPARAAGLAWPRGCHRPASAAATDGRHSWTPIGGREGDHTSGI